MRPTRLHRPAKRKNNADRSLWPSSKVVNAPAQSTLVITKPLARQSKVWVKAAPAASGARLPKAKRTVIKAK